mmetsp:Transcript_29557/g.47004  ORF Transcript_29557/g.47004 Transcript_29557/m.47004 type:complete len:423 (-) Transcript_29557:325-1593(-)|eukprot:CAMPEP_0197032134 /NCGR_PEP_ID=MMETSP1384-20130603/10883_1 /TAXON_ID=29189 /ORGANISM="Ammonia sp." /LENGTH=422 /DNA_ID=CAMNT_0042461743 /DNA_START=89 /DNA_END=1357 /DNA_ORIENTATION=-
MDDAFADSSVERAANAGGAGYDLDASQDWPPSHIAHYDYDAQYMSGNNSFVDINVDEDPMLGDIKSAEEMGLLSGDIELADQYKPEYLQKKQNNSNLLGRPKKNNNNKLLPHKQNKQRNGNPPKNNYEDAIMKQASGLKSAFRDKLSSQTKDQMDKYAAPSFETNLGLSAWCTALFYWIPIRYLAWLGSMALFVLPFLDVRFQSGMTFVEWLLYWYIQLFAIVAIFVESPTWILTKRIQLTIYKWCRILRRTWGRALFYISISLLTFAELQGGAKITLSMFAGIYMCILSVIMLFFSMLSAKQYRLMRLYMATGGNLNGKQIVKLVGDEYQDNADNAKKVENVDYDKMVSRVASYFNELDQDRDGRIGAAELHAFAEQALRRNLSNAERYTLQTFLDNGCNGFISKTDWIQQFCDYGPVSFL